MITGRGRGIGYREPFIERAKSELGYVPRYDFFEDLKKYTEFLKKG